MEAAGTSIYGVRHWLQLLITHTLCHWLQLSDQTVLKNHFVGKLFAYSEIMEAFKRQNISPSVVYEAQRSRLIMMLGVLLLLIIVIQTSSIIWMNPGCEFYDIDKTSVITAPGKLYHRLYFNM